MKKSNFTLSIEAKLKKIPSKKSKMKFTNEHYIKGNGMETTTLKFFNLTMPVVRNQLIELFPTKTESYSEHLFNDMQKLWFESNYFEAKTIALCWLEQQNDKFLISQHKKILLWVNAVDNWAHSDGYCSVLARMFEHSQNLLLPTYLKWNKHKNSWLRRCSMVGTFYYSYHRTKQPSFKLIKSLIDPHFTAPEYYVQKAVGWTIRELYNEYPIETIKYIQNNLAKITPIAWVAASEKLKPEIKNILLKKRKIIRKKIT